MWLLLLLLPSFSIAGEALTVDFDPTVAAERSSGWKEDCEKRNVGVACGNLGALHALGKGVARDFEKAYFYYEKACRFGQALRCLRAGTFAVNGKGTTASPEKAAELFALGCKLLDPESCVSYYAVTHGSKITLEGEARPLANGPKSDPAMLQQVATTLTLACNKAVVSACGNLGGLYEEGEAVPRELPRALQYFERACELGDADRCARAGRYYANGAGMSAVDSTKAEQLFRRFCELKGLIACPLAQRAKLGMPIDLKLGEAKPKGAAPKVSDWVSGTALDSIHADGVGAELAKLIDDCNQGDARACGNAAAAFLDEQGKPTSRADLARRLVEKACALGRAQRCADLARYFSEGWGGEKSAEKEKAALKRACELGHKESCGR